MRRWLESHPGDCPVPVGALGGYDIDHFLPRGRGGHDHPYNYFVMPAAANRSFRKDVTEAKAAYVGRRAARCADRFAREMRDQASARARVCVAEGGAGPGERAAARLRGRGGCGARRAPRLACARARARGSYSRRRRVLRLCPAARLPANRRRGQARPLLRFSLFSPVDGL